MSIWKGLVAPQWASSAPASQHLLLRFQIKRFSSKMVRFLVAPLLNKVCCPASKQCEMISPGIQCPRIPAVLLLPFFTAPLPGPWAVPSHSACAGGYSSCRPAVSNLSHCLQGCHSGADRKWAGSSSERTGTVLQHRSGTETGTQTKEQSEQRS